MDADHQYHHDRSQPSLTEPTTRAVSHDELGRFNKGKAFDIMKEVNSNLEKQVAGLVHTKEKLYDQITLVKQDRDQISRENKMLIEEKE